MTHLAHMYFISCTFAFCSIVYEFLLAQSLAAFLGHTVLRYSLTLGLYIFSAGVGAVFVSLNRKSYSVSNLMVVECLLSVLGGLLILGSFSLYSFFSGGIGFVISIHLLILLVGFLSGCQLLMILKMVKSESMQGVVGFYSLGIFLGTFAFAFLFYPQWGLLPTAFAVATLNALSGISLYGINDAHSRARLKIEPITMLIFLVVAVGSLVGFFYADPMYSFFINRYLMG